MSLIRLERNEGTFYFVSDEFPAPEMNNQNKIDVGHWEWELGSNPGTRFCLVSSNVFIGSLRYDLNRLYHIRIGLAVGVSDVNSLRWKTYIRSSGTTDKRLAEPIVRELWQQRHRQKYLGNRERRQISDILDQLICENRNLTRQTMPGLGLPVSLETVCGFLNEKKHSDGF